MTKTQQQLKALLGIEQRVAHASRAHISPNRKPRKTFPTSAKTAGDYIQTARVAQQLARAQLAERLNVPKSLVQAWEENRQMISELQWDSLRTILALPPISGLAVPTVG
jgi:DNA-binding transcriptional regulator YiaG